MQREREVAWAFETKNPTTTTRVIPRSLAADNRVRHLLENTVDFSFTDTDDLTTGVECKHFDTA